MFDIIGSIVLYNNPLKQIQQAIDSFLNTEMSVRLYVIDNSPDDRAGALCKDARVVYIFNGRNLGFGAGHNVALKRSIGEAAYHLVMNPDVYFEPGVLETMIQFASPRSDIGLLMPKILNPDGSLQYLCKRLPSPTDLILRRFLPAPLKPFVQARLDRYEMRDQDYNRTLSVPALSGCFMLISDAALAEVGGFDERYFMYLEDVDMSRRIHQKFKTIYYPQTAIYHRNGKGSYRQMRPLKYHLVSAFRYFQKWGWYSDPERVSMNDNAAIAPITASRKFNSAAQD